MDTRRNTVSASIHQRLTHPVIDSDIGHFDVIDTPQVLAEAYELVEDDLLTEDDFRDFVFGNAVRLWAGTNPDFFTGTAIEQQAAGYLKQESG